MAQLTKKQEARKKADAAKARLLKRRKAALAKLGADEAAINRSGLVFGSKTAAQILGVSAKALATMIEPSDYATNPHYRSGPSVSLYDPLELLRVSKQKRCEKARLRRTPERKAAGQAAAETRREKALAEARAIVDKWKVRLPSISWRDLTRRAHDSYVREAEYHNREPSYFRVETDMRTLVLNYLRHECSDYGNVLSSVTDALRGRVARDRASDDDPVSEASAILHKRIVELAREKWPEMRDE